VDASAFSAAGAMLQDNGTMHVIIRRNLNIALFISR